MYYTNRDCALPDGTVFSWERVPQAKREYYVGLANAALTTDCEIRGTRSLMPYEWQDHDNPH